MAQNEKKEDLSETILGAVVLIVVVWLFAFDGCDYIGAKFKGEKTKGEIKKAKNAIYDAWPEGLDSDEALQATFKFFRLVQTERLDEILVKTGRNPNYVSNFRWVPWVGEDGDQWNSYVGRFSNAYMRKDNKGNDVYVLDHQIEGRISYDYKKPDGVYQIRDEVFKTDVLTGWVKRGAKFYQVTEWTPFP